MNRQNLFNFCYKLGFSTCPFKEWLCYFVIHFNDLITFYYKYKVILFLRFLSLNSFGYCRISLLLFFFFCSDLPFSFSLQHNVTFLACRAISSLGYKFQINTMSDNPFLPASFIPQLQS